MKVGTRLRIFWIIAAIMVAAVIFYFSSQASGKSEDLSDAFAGFLKIEQKHETMRVSNQGIFLGLTLRKLAHIFLFAALGFCLYNAYLGICFKYRFPLAMGSGYLYGVLDEIHQSMSGRYGRWQDTLIDLAGVVIGICVAISAIYLLRCVICKERWNTEEQDAK